MNYTLIRKRNNRKMYLRYKDGQIVVTAPLYTSKRDIDAFVSRNEDWIEEQKKKNEFNTLKDGDCIHFVDGYYILKIDPSIKRISIKNQVITIRDQKDFEKILKKKGTEILEPIFRKVEEELGFTSMNFKVGVYSSKWGSCSKSKRDIHLNGYLIMTSYDFILSVIYHEFAHMYISNHSKDFYALVYSWMPNYKEIHNQYKKFQFPKVEV